MAISKVILNGTTLMDVTQDTVASNNLLTGYTAHGADGDALTGEYAVPSGTINILQNGVVDVTSYASANVNVSGGGAVEEKDVNFYDYDGTLVDSYTKTEFAALSAMPSNPSHTGLTAQGWNWSLSDAKTYVNSYDKLDIGQMYVTDDGKTRIYIHLDEGRLEPYLGFCINGTAVVDWGDGSSTSTVTGTSTSTNISTQHTYSIVGNYVISIAVTGTIALLGNSSVGGSQILLKSGTSLLNENKIYQNCIQKIEIGNNVNIEDRAFANLTALECITISKNISISSGNNCFSGCTSLKNIIIPSGVANAGSSMFANCYSLLLIMLPNSISNIDGYAFSGLVSLKHFYVPSSVITINGNAFSGNYSLSSVLIPNTTTTINNSAFVNCRTLKNIVVPNSVTSIGSDVFRGCYCLSSVVLSNSASSISGTFRDCYSLSSIEILDNITSIGSYTFNNCYGLGKIKFNSQTPPSISSSNAWSNLPKDCKIYVPSGSLSSYTGASNYPSSSTYTYIEY